MEHAGAIAQFVVPLLLCVLCGIASYGLYMHKEAMRRNEREHDRFADTEAGHDQRLTRVETRVEHVEAEIRFIRGRP